MGLADKAVFPIFGKTLAQCDPQTGVVTVLGGTGMTLLEHYAGLAMQGLVSNADACALYREKRTGDHQVGHLVAKESVRMARALLAELEKEQQA